jgi:hypothetical protein
MVGEIIPEWWATSSGISMVRDAVLGIGGGPLVSLAVATNTLAALTGSASGHLVEPI